MIIGIDAHIVGASKGGVERFLREMCVRLPRVAAQHRFVLFINPQTFPFDAMAGSPAVELVPLPFSNPLIERALVLPWLARRHRLDVLLVQRLAPWAMGRCRIALTVHDITPLKYPQQYPGLTNSLVRRLTPGSVRRSGVVFTPTQTIAAELARTFAEPAAKFVPYYNAFDRAAFTPDDSAERRAALCRRLGLESAFVFCSGAFERRKNFETVLQAVAALPPATRPQLVLAGAVRDAAYAAEIAALAESPVLAGRVRRLGFVSDADLIDLYRGATAFVSASYDEGFNMPLLEAMACGTPVLCSDIPVHRELFDGGALFFAAASHLELAAGLQRLQAEPALRAALVQGGHASAQRYDWDAAALRIVAALTAQP